MKPSNLIIIEGYRGFAIVKLFKEIEQYDYKDFKSLYNGANHFSKELDQAMDLFIEMISKDNNPDGIKVYSLITKKITEI